MHTCPKHHIPKVAPFISPYLGHLETQIWPHVKIGITRLADHVGVPEAWEKFNIFYFGLECDVGTIMQHISRFWTHLTSWLREMDFSSEHTKWKISWKTTLPKWLLRTHGVRSGDDLGFERIISHVPKDATWIYPKSSIHIFPRAICQTRPILPKMAILQLPMSWEKSVYGLGTYMYRSVGHLHTHGCQRNDPRSSLVASNASRKDMVRMDPNTAWNGHNMTKWPFKRI